MRVFITCPFQGDLFNGNRAIAERWSRIIQALGHQVSTGTEYRGTDAEVLIAIHAVHSYNSIQRYQELHPNRPLIVTVSGTDLYKAGDQPEFLYSLEVATQIVVLQSATKADLPEKFQNKTKIINQSAEKPDQEKRLFTDRFTVCVVGHLRAVKDPMRTARAARDLPDTSRIMVVQIGRALDEQYRIAAEAEMEINPRYQWLGERSHSTTLEILAGSDLMCVTSQSEGGPNVICEACVCGIPVISSKMSGAIGLLDALYPGFFPFGDTAALTELLQKVETDQAFYRDLRDKCKERALLFAPAQEIEAWGQLLSI